MMEIIHYERANKNKTIGYADIRVPILKPTVIVLRKIAHVQSGDRKWFNLPSFSRDADGVPKYFRYAEFENQPHNSQLMEAMNEKVKKFCAEHGIEEIPAMEFDTFPAGKFEPINELPF